MSRLVLAWAVTALAATVAAVAVLGLLGGSITGASSRVLTASEVRGALATARAAPSAPGAGPAADGKLFRTAGGTVTVSCASGSPVLRSWSPAQGYSVDDVDPAKGELKFEPEDGEDVEIRLACSGGEPVMLRR